MFQPVPDERHTRRRRFGFAEIAVIAAILAFGGFTLIADGHQSLSELLSGFSETVGR